MMVSRHIGLSLPVTAAAYFYTDNFLSSLLFFAGAVFIDVDHYLDYAVRERDISLRAAYDYNMEVTGRALRRDRMEPLLHYFHTVEFFAAVSVLTLFFRPLGWLLAGAAFHICLDLIEILRKYDTGVRSFSILWSLTHKR